MTFLIHLPHRRSWRDLVKRPIEMQSVLVIHRLEGDLGSDEIISDQLPPDERKDFQSPTLQKQMSASGAMCLS
jgi:hypothetical protein